MQYKNFRKKRFGRKKRIIFVLSCIVTFLTVFSLVLPAITIDKETADEDNGIVLNDNRFIDTKQQGEEADNTAETISSLQNKTEETKEISTSINEEAEYPSVIFSDSINDTLVHISAPEGAFPKGTVMTLKEVENEEVSASVGEVINNNEIISYKAIDINFVYNGEKIEPRIPIEVSMTSNFISEEPKVPLLVHIDDEGKADVLKAKKPEEDLVETISENSVVKELIENNNDIDEITIDNTLTFESDSFSLYVLVYTVDFEYIVDGQMYRFSMPGGGFSSFHNLMEVLGILGDTNYDTVDDFIRNIEQIKSSNSTLVWVGKADTDTTIGELKAANGLECQYSADLTEEEIEEINAQTVQAGDWALISLRSFETEETLTVTMKNGDTFEIRVTDPPGPGNVTSNNLEDFLTNVSIAAPTNEQGAYVIEPGTSYTINLSFNETAARPGQSGLQFGNGSLTYQIPEGLNFDGSTGTFDVKITRGPNTYTISGNSLSVENGVLTVNFNTSDPNYERLAASNNVGFTISISGSITEDSTEIKFSDSIIKDIVVDKSNSVSTSKSAYVDVENNKIYYTTTVTSSGSSTNVVVTDSITGTGVTLDRNSITASSSTGQTVSMTANQNGNSGNSFSYTIPSMANGEIITFRYSADIDPSVLQMVNGKVISQSGNTFQATSDGDPDGDSTTVNNTIDYTPKISKSSGTASNVVGNTTTMDWSITVNPDAKVSAAGTVVTDTIGQNSQSIMKYSGTGITVKVYDAAGNLVRTDHETWSSLGVDISSATAWNYTIPLIDSDQAYQYVIAYSTDVDTSNITSLTTVENTGTTNGGGSSTGSGQVGPSKEQPDMVKSVAKVDRANKEVTWTVTFTVPADGLSKAVVTDTYPNAWIDNGSTHVFEVVKNGSVSVTGLEGGEDFSVTYGDAAAVITFTNNGSAGLKGTGSTRTIVVTLKTEISDAWLEKSKSETWLVDKHINTAELDYGSKINSTAIAQIASDTLKKSASVFGTRTVDGVELPVYKYEIVMTGVESDVFTITDTFDTSILEPYTVEPDSWNPSNCYMFGGTQWHQGYRGANPVSYISTTTGMTFQVTADSLPKDNGAYYTAYKLVYYLAVKDAQALNTLMNRAAAEDDGKYDLSNTATWNGQTDTTSVTYSYQGLDKEILTSDEDLSKTNEEIYANFRITLNPAGMLLNGGEPLTMTDTVSNLSVDITSIKAVPSNGVSWDMSGNTVTYTIPDATKVVITYKARVIYTENGETTINFSNTAEMKGYKDTINKTATHINNAQGSGNIYYIQLMKYEAGNMTKRLPDAVFALYNSKTSTDSDGNTIDVIDLDNPVRKDNGEGEQVTFTTDAKGMITVEGDQDKDGWSIAQDTRYFLRETSAPEGYMLSSFDYSFQVSSDGTTNYSQYIYHSGDTLSAKNYPGTDVQVNKVWSDGNENHSSDTVTVKLQQRIQTGTDENDNPVWGDWSDTIRMEDSSNNYAWTDFTSGKSITLNASNNWSGAFNGLPLEVPFSLTDPNADDVAADYQVVETLVNSSAPESSNVSIVKSTEGGAYVFTITNTVVDQSGALKLTKLVTVNGESTTTTLADGNYTFTITGPEGASADESISKTVVITVTNGVAASATVDDKAVDLEGGYVIVPGLAAGTYTIAETRPTNGTSISKINGEDSGVYSTTVTVTAGDTTAAADGASASFTNNIDIGYLKIHKEVTYNGVAPSTAEQKQDLAGKYTFKIYKDENCTQAVMDGENEKTLTVTIGADGAAADSGVIALPVGTYWIQEQTPEQNGVTPDENPLEISITKDRTSNAPGVVSFVNNCEDNDNPDELAIELRKTFTGLTDSSEIPSDFKVILTYNVPDSNDPVPVELTRTTVGHVTCTKSADGMTWQWHVTHIPSNATNFAVSESNYNVNGYTRITKINGSVVENPGNPQTVTVLVPTITMSNATSDYTTTDNNKVFTVADNQILLVRMTNHATVIVSQKSLGIAERTAIESMIHNNGGKIPGTDGANAQWVENYVYFSHEIQGDSFSYVGRTIYFDENEVRIPHNSSSHEVRVDIGFISESAENSFTLENDYNSIPITVEIEKIKKDDTSIKLPGAVFTLRQIADSEPGNGGIYPNVTGAETQTSVPTAEGTGKTSFANLSSGYYELKETIAPLGYVLTGETVTYFKISGGVLTWLEKGSGKPSTWQEKRSKGSGELISFTAAVAADPENVVEAQNAVFAVENTPGAALPNTGGPGTRLFTILGTILILGAGVLLWRRRRLI